MSERVSGRSLLKRVFPVAVVAAAVLAFFGLGLDRYLTVEALRDNRAALAGFVAGNFALAALVYMAIYAGVVALSVPGGALMTLAGGFLFGAFWGTALVEIGRAHV